jgi:alpha-tubulin suppressor-like RCC1 family protein
MNNDIISFGGLSDDEIIQIALQLSINDISSYCSSSKRFNDVICDNNWFWKQKTFYDFGDPDYDYVDDWKVLYKNYGAVYAFGQNNYGQLGLGDERSRSKPTKIPNFRVKSIVAGNSHTIAIDFNDDVCVFGHNNFGQLGLGDTTDRVTPTKIPFGAFLSETFKAKDIFAGATHTIAIDFNNDIWVFGNNFSGQLGLGDEIPRYVPTKIPFETFGLQNFKVKSIIAGSDHTIAIDLNDDVWVFGDNKFGQLGLGDRINRNIPTKIPNFKAKSIVAGGNHTIAIDFNDEVWGFGENNSGQLGLGHTDDTLIPTKIPFRALGLPNLKFQSVSTGTSHTIAMDFDNNLWSFGGNVSGQLGLGDQIFRLIPTQIKNFKFKSFITGTYYTIAIDFFNNDVWVFGSNFYGQLGLGDRTNRYIPTKIPNFKCNLVTAGGGYTIAISDHEYHYEYTYG